MARQLEAEVRKLRPTQITIGFIEVSVKRKDLESLGKHKQREFLAAHLIPAVVGPEEHIFITDHHHLARAALEAGIEAAFLMIEADMRQLDYSPFLARDGREALGTSDRPARRAPAVLGNPPAP